MVFFENTTPQFIGWYKCPVCEGSIDHPPKPDAQVEKTLSYLYHALGEQVPDPPSIPEDPFWRYIFRL